MAQIFMSYRQSDRPVADRLRADLAAMGHTAVSADAPDTHHGPKWYRQVEMDVDASDAVVVIVGSEISEWQESEIQQVLEKSWKAPDTKVVPVMLGQQRVPSALGDFQAVVVETSSENWTDEVIRAVEETSPRPITYPDETDKRKLAVRNSAFKSWVNEQRKNPGTNR